MEVPLQYYSSVLFFLICVQVASAGIEQQLYYSPPPHLPVIQKTVIQEPPKVFVYEVPVKVFVRVCPGGNCDSSTATNPTRPAGPPDFDENDRVPIPPSASQPPLRPPSEQDPVLNPPLTPPPVLDVPVIPQTPQENIPAAPCRLYGVDKDGLCRLNPKKETTRERIVKRTRVKYRPVHVIVDRRTNREYVVPQFNSNNGINNSPVIPNSNPNIEVRIQSMTPQLRQPNQPLRNDG